MFLIGISGKAYSGKDTMGKYLINKYNFKRKASADALKRIARNIFGWNGVKDEKGRRFLQELATTVRNFDPDFWINIVLNEIKQESLSSKNSKYVITDLRYKNEAELLKSLGGMLIRVEGSYTNMTTISPDLAIHTSEIDLDNYNNFDYVLKNNTSFENLYKNLDHIISNNLKNENTLLSQETPKI